jgi:hypothetical protein
MSPKSKIIVKGFNQLQHYTELLDLLERFRYCEASKPRDKIYALLRVASDVNPGDVNDEHRLHIASSTAV